MTTNVYKTVSTKTTFFTTDKNRLNSASANLPFFEGTGQNHVFDFSISITPVLGSNGMSEQEQVIITDYTKILISP